MSREEQYNFFLNMMKILIYINEKKLDNKQINEVHIIKNEICNSIDSLIHSSGTIDTQIIDNIKEKVHKYLNYVHDEYFY